MFLLDERVIARWMMHCDDEYMQNATMSPLNTTFADHLTATTIDFMTHSEFYWPGQLMLFSYSITDRLRNVINVSNHMILMLEAITVDLETDLFVAELAIDDNADHIHKNIKSKYTAKAKKKEQQSAEKADKYKSGRKGKSAQEKAQNEQDKLDRITSSWNKELQDKQYEDVREILKEKRALLTHSVNIAVHDDQYSFENAVADIRERGSSQDRSVSKGMKKRRTREHPEPPIDLELLRRTMSTSSSSGYNSNAALKMETASNNELKEDEPPDSLHDLRQKVQFYKLIKL